MDFFRVGYRRSQIWTQQRLLGRTVPYSTYLIRYFLVYKLTLSGRSIAFTMVMVTLMAFYTLSIPVYQLLVSLFTLLAVSMVWGWCTPAKITIHGSVPGKVTAGTRAQARFTLRNRGASAARELGARLFWLPRGRQQAEFGHRVSEHEVTVSKRYMGGKFLARTIVSEESTIEYLAPGEEGMVELDLEFARRGIYELPGLLVYTQFPFNLFRTPARVNEDFMAGRGSTVIVLPKFVVAEGINVPTSRSYQPGGISLTSDIGESPEYIGSREYRSGDSIRKIDFRGWARRGEPVVREYQEEYYCRVAVIMDTFVGAGESDETLEGAVQLTAAVADALSGGEYIIDLFAAGPDLYVFRSGRHTAHFDNILEILACLEQSLANPFDEVGPVLRDEVANISTAVFVFMDWDESRERMVRMAAESGCSVKIYIVREGATTLPVEGAELLSEGVMMFTPEEVRLGRYGVL